MAKSIAVRVDDRLIHGQVVTQWVKVFNTQHIIVIDNKVAKDKMQKNVLKFAAPPDMKVSVLSVDKAAQVWEKNQFGNKNVFILFKDVMQIKECKEKGIDLKEVTIGNVSTVNGRKQVFKSTGFTEEEAKTVLELRDSGINVYFQTQPNDKKESVDVLKNTFPGI